MGAPDPEPISPEPTSPEPTSPEPTSPEPGDPEPSVAGGKTRLAAVIRSDFAGARWSSRLALAGVVVWLAYEWGPGNETLTPFILARVIGHFDGVAVIPLTALVGFAFTTVQQLASGFTALTGFSMFERTSGAAWRRLARRFDVVPGRWDQLSWPARCVLVFGLGTTAVVLVQITASGSVGVRRHRGVVVRSATLCGALVAAVGAFGASLALAGRRVDALRGATQGVLRVLGNPLFWFGLVVLGALVRGVRASTAQRSAGERFDGSVDSPGPPMDNGATRR